MSEATGDQRESGIRGLIPPRALRALELSLTGPTLGAMWVSFLTVRSLSADDDGYMGFRAAPVHAVLEVARTRFGDDVRGLTWAFAAIAIGLGAAIGVGAEL